MSVATSEDNLKKQIGLLVGPELSWPASFIAEVNSRDEGVWADFVEIGETLLDSSCPYDLIIDRMSHEVPYYRTYLKFAAVKGCYVINNPFMSAADDKFFGVALGTNLGIHAPKTVALPNKRVEKEGSPENFRNLVYPMEWQEIIDYVGVPAILKDIHTGGRTVSQRVNDVDELLRWYDESDTLTLVVQEIVESDYHVHCFVVGQREVLVARYLREEGRYLPEGEEVEAEVLRATSSGALTLTRAYGYDVNLVEYVVQKDRPHLINPTNPAPDMGLELLGEANFRWSVDRIADFAIEMVHKSRPQFDASHGYEAFRQRPGQPS
jgi:hypothetical protein